MPQRDPGEGAKLKSKLKFIFNFVIGETRS